MLQERIRPPRLCTSLGFPFLHRDANWSIAVQKNSRLRPAVPLELHFQARRHKKLPVASSMRKIKNPTLAPKHLLPRDSEARWIFLAKSAATVQSLTVSKIR